MSITYSSFQAFCLATALSMLCTFPALAAAPAECDFGFTKGSECSGYEENVANHECERAAVESIGGGQVKNVTVSACTRQGWSPGWIWGTMYVKFTCAATAHNSEYDAPHPQLKTDPRSLHIFPLGPWSMKAEVSYYFSCPDRI